MYTVCGILWLLIGVDYLAALAFMLLNLIIFVSALQASGVLLSVGGCAAAAHVEATTRMPAHFLAIGMAAVHLGICCGIGLTLLDHAGRRRVG